MKTPVIPIAREGYPFIFFSAFCALVCGQLNYEIAALICLSLTAFTTYFFRDPTRIKPNHGNCLVAPADGKVILIEKMFDDRFVNDHVHKISIFMNIFDVHVNRLPLAGTVEQILFQPGKFYSADKDKAALHNEYCAMIVRSTENNIRYGVTQVAGLIARRIVCWAEKGDELTTGQRYGLIRFGSRVDLYLPAQIDLEVKVGQRVTAAETILAHLEPKK